MSSKLVSFVSLLPLFLVSCTKSGRPFDATSWKQGDSELRGAMTATLIKQKILIGKSGAEVQSLLGAPDFCGIALEKEGAVSPRRCGDADENWYAYEVVTVYPRPPDQRYFCACRLEIRFAKQSRLAESVDVRD